MLMYRYFCFIDIEDTEDARMLTNQLWHFCNLFPYFHFNINEKWFNILTDAPVFNDIQENSTNRFFLLFQDSDTDTFEKDSNILGYILNSNPAWNKPLPEISFELKSVSDSE